MASKNSNQINVPQAREAMDKFKMQAAQEMGVNLKQGYNGDLTSREAGSVGGQMVKKMSTVRTANYTRADRTAIGPELKVRYIATITISGGRGYEKADFLYVQYGYCLCGTEILRWQHDRHRHHCRGEGGC